MSLLVTTNQPQRKPVHRAPFDVQAVRSQFPILAEKIHGQPLVYLDNAATTQKPQRVLNAMDNYYRRQNANIHRAVHTLSERATEAYEEARVTVQRFIGAPCLREVIFTRGATEAINLVAQTFGRMTVHAGDEIILTGMEHHANIVPWQVLAWEKKANLRVVPFNERGELRMDELEKLINPSTKILAVSMVSNALGTVNPVEEIIRVAHQHGIAVLVDGAQAAPHQAIDVARMDCDFFVMSGHKVYGPTGIGILYGKPAHMEEMPPYQTGGDMIGFVSFERTTWNELPNKFEAGTPNIAGAVGLAAAVEFMQEIGLDNIAAHEHRLLEHATRRLDAIPGIRIIGTAAHKAGVLSFVVDDPPISALDVGSRLDLAGVAVRTGHHCCQPLMAKLGIPGTIRASFALYNTLEEVDVFADTLEKIIASARPRPVAKPQKEVVYPGPSANSPQAVADDLIELFDFLDDWTDKHQHLIELGEKILPMPEEMKTEENRVHGCQSTVFLSAREKPGHKGVLEFHADANADIVRGLVALLQNLFSGQKATDVLDFDVPAFLHRVGLDNNLTTGRRNGLSSMVDRIRAFARGIATT